VAEAVMIDGFRPSLTGSKWAMLPSRLPLLLKMLWDGDPTTRPTFLQIIECGVFDHCTIDAAFAEHSESAPAHFWRRHFLEDVAVPYHRFISLFGPAFKCDTAPGAPSERALHAALAEPSELGSEQVTLEGFARCVREGHLTRLVGPG
jgi:hypothetical protein